MTYTPSTAEETHVLAVIELTGTTLYYADSHLSMSDGNFYEGRLEVSSLSRAFSSWTEPRQRQSTLTISLKDRDGTVRALLESYTWGLRRVAVYVGKGRDLDDYTLDFEGIIKFPGGISYDSAKVTIRLRDARDRDKVTLPADTYLADDYPNVESKWTGKPIPVVYGDWSDVAVPAACVDTTVNEFRIAGHPIAAIVQVYQNGTAVSHTDEDLSAATFRIASYDPKEDTVTVCVQGKKDGAGAFITHPVDVLYDMQTDLLGIAAVDIDTDSYAEVETELAGFAARRWIGSSSSSDTLIEELAMECGFDLMVVNGKYAIKSRIPGQAYETLYDAANVKADSMSVEFDPEGLYCNRAVGSYGYDPMNDVYLCQAQADAETEQAALGEIRSRTIEYNWLYNDFDVEAVLGRTLLLYASEIRVITFTGLGDALLAQLADRAGLTFANFDRRPLLVRQIGKYYKARSCEIQGYDALSFSGPGYWAGDGAPNWDAASAEERAANGFWTDDDGYAKTGDDTSKVSHWW